MGQLKERLLICPDPRVTLSVCQLVGTVAFLEQPVAVTVFMRPICPIPAVSIPEE
jgi:hypothetical protein